ncbi:MAG: hypothetical protein ACC726_13260, partial [Chloroflexota bacterium]
ADMSTFSTRAFDPERLLHTLVTHGVRFVLIGGWAAKLQGSPTVTADIDICYDRSPDNLERPASALSDLDVRLRGVPESIPLVLDVGAFTPTTRSRFRRPPAISTCWRLRQASVPSMSWRRPQTRWSWMSSESASLRSRI